MIVFLVAHGADPTRTYVDGAMSIMDRAIRHGRRVESILMLLGQ